MEKLMQLTATSRKANLLPVAGSHGFGGLILGEVNIHDAMLA
jgi:hypothetical protein